MLVGRREQLRSRLLQWNNAGYHTNDKVIVDSDYSSVENISGSAVRDFTRGWHSLPPVKEGGRSTLPISLLGKYCTSQAHSEWEVTSSRRSCALKPTRKFGRSR